MGPKVGGCFILGFGVVDCKRPFTLGVCGLGRLRTRFKPPV